ncbi:exodeoxyribonuclease V subunit beta [Vibrio metschnikovii]|uniref:exodeoxyribonuclease V subunit beta n=1 Tax=Vibrio metschnikovii TaxID=28172 RepID=UPI001C30B274|nr:exodeoxyribonuclease V subunit beta [Vibrio metschnikovii]
MSSTSSAVVTPLDPLTFPLHGARLIEASAGTGKTFTIAGLYLRLLLGHGDATTRHPTPLTVDQILVVTFTEAATAELRDRIRQRIHLARLAFLRGSSDDPVIQGLLADYDDHILAAKVLLQAERQMDEAAVYTIHGFCQRMLTQNAFESGSRFNHEFITNESDLKAQVVADYWRRQFYPLALELAAEVRRLWPSPQALLEKIGGYLTGSPLSLSVQAMEGELSALYQTCLARVAELKQQWLQHHQDITPCIEGSDLHAATKKALLKRVDFLTQWAHQTSHQLLLPDELTEFTQTGLNAKSKKGNPPQHALFVMIEDFLSQPNDLYAPLLAHAIAHCRHRLAKAKAQKQWLSFDDLLTQLSAAIDQDESGQLTDRIRQLYPVAMIDEFQDTDPLQYSIFSRIYLPQAECGLLMIGDPKQAIYGFRGADIFTYIKARQQVSAHYTLGTNWRSSAQMVSAVNQLFSSSTSPFMYDQDIPFLPVAASPNADKRQWLLNGHSQPALTYWLQEADKPIPKTEYLSCMAKACASQIQAILTAAQHQQAYFKTAHGQKLIQAGDIAVLVRTGSEGRMIKQALAEQGIASVYLSNRDSVFSSDVALDMQRLLQAVLTPDDERALRACLASPLFALDALSLDELNNNEIVWDKVLNEFKGYRQLWAERGVLPMLRNVMSKRHIAERWLAEPNGERLLTDFMHIGELLQQARQEIESDHGLLRWLAQAISDAEQGIGGRDEQIQRLESEQNLVQIVTIHKSKGLEYDLVFLPFVAGYREASEGKYYDSVNDQTVLDITDSSAALEQADKERLAEDLRLLYVALTRAVYGCFIGLAPLRNGRSTKEPTGVHLSAIGYLLQNGQEAGIAELHSALNAQVRDAIVVTAPPPLQSEPFTALVAEKPILKAQTLHTHIDRHWRLTSYSALVKHSSKLAYDEASLDISGFDIDSGDEQHQALLLEPERSIFTFPRGATPGTFLHSLFEVVEFTESASSDENQQRIIELMEREQIELEWLPVLQQLVDTVLATPLDGKALRLNQKNAQQRLVEMEFLLPVEVLSAPALNRIIQRYDPLSAKAGELGFYPVQGMLKGFIDLVFEHQGKYYLLDWKSNHLGDEIGAYHGERLKAAMVEHRYDLQYQLYALALHRFLRSRLADYDYQRHFGGVYYLFLRGIDGHSEHGIFSTKPSLELLTEMDALIDGKTLETRTTEVGQMELDL